MSWSECFNGYQSPVMKESFQRIALTVNIAQFNNGQTIKTLTNYVSSNFFHLCVIVDDKAKGNDIKSMLKVMKNLLAIETTTQMKSSDHMVFSIQLDLISLLKDIIQELTNQDILSVVMVNFNGDKFKFVEEMTEYAKFNESTHNRVYLGIGNIENQNDLDWILSKIPRKSIEMVNVGKAALPDLSLRKLEIIHKYGCNTMINMGSMELNNVANSQHLKQLSMKYGVSSETLLTKSLLQLGYIVSIDIRGLNETYCRSHFERVIHPFVYRRSFVSSVRLISLEVSEEDVEDIANKSEETESKLDLQWMSFATERLPDRDLSNVLDLSH